MDSVKVLNNFFITNEVILDFFLINEVIFFFKLKVKAKYAILR